MSEYPTRKELLKELGGGEAPALGFDVLYDFVRLSDARDSVIKRKRRMNQRDPFDRSDEMGTD